MKATPAQPPEPTPAASGEVRGWLEQYGPALRRYFRRRAGAAEAEDLVQEVFIRLVARSRGDEVEDVERYLFRIANNVLISRHRHDTALVRRAGETFEDADRADEISPERALIGKQALSQLALAVQALPPRTREAFVYHRFEEMTYAAIAARMGISASGVEKLIQRAMEHILCRMGPAS
jgi:RNA polymerase sigma factor (sigma-70 family)